MFHAPERARFNDIPQQMRTTKQDGNNGVFLFPPIESNWRLICICSDGGNWEHVSIRATRDDGNSRVPSWKEMCFIKNEFWDDEDTVIQYHPKKSEYINNHPHVLHLWRPTNLEIPIPDKIMVGI